jgi:hypothetical protein
MAFSPMTLTKHRRELDELMRSHPRIFPEYDPNSLDYCDEMPAVYRKGLEGQVVGHPLEGA